MGQLSGQMAEIMGRVAETFGEEPQYNTEINPQQYEEEELTKVTFYFCKLYIVSINLLPFTDRRNISDTGAGTLLVYPIAFDGGGPFNQRVKPRTDFTDA